MPAEEARKIFIQDDTFKDFVDEFNKVIDGGGGSPNPAGMVIFTDTIEEDIVIESNQRALAIDVTVASGVTVTVEPGATFVIL